MATNPLPLFPLRVVLLPEEFLPLHIFEERYKVMIGECQEKDLPFGVVLAEERDVRSAGCTARITEVIEEFPDGRKNILTRGEERFRILAVQQDRPYLTADVEYFDDDPEESPPADLMEKIIAALSEAQKNTGLNLDEIREDPKRLSFGAGAALQLSLPDKQSLLESVSARERMEILVRLIEEKNQREQLAVSHRRSAARNGHPLK